MPRIYFDFSGLKQLETACMEAASHTERLNDSFGATIRQLDWEIRMAEEVARTGARLEEQMRSEVAALRKYEQFLSYAAEQYRRLDTVGVEDSFGAGERFAGPWGGFGGMGSRQREKDPLQNPSLSLIEHLMEILSKLAPQSPAGIIKEQLGYVDDLEKFLRGDIRGATGAQELMDLGGSSCSLWKAMYDQLEDQGRGWFFTDPGQKTADGIGLTGDALQAAASLYGAVDTIRNSDMGLAGDVGELIDAGSDTGDLIQSITELGKASPEGVYTPAKIYTTIYESYLDAIGQGLKSYDKYSADGQWDLRDTGATGVEAGVTGLYKMAECLTFGVISEETTGVSSEEISGVLESWAENRGREAGEYIMNNPELYQKYQEAGDLGQFAITMYAAIRS